MSEAQFSIEHIAEVPRGWHVFTKTTPTGHELRFAFPPGPRRRGAGKLLEILHPHGENGCDLRRANPGEELLIFGNPGDDAFDSIRHGSRVTFLDRFGKKQTGRAVMRGPFGWVLNMGGRYGTPAVVSRDMIVSVRAGNPEPGDAQVAETHRKKVAAMLAKMPKPIRDVFDRNPETLILEPNFTKTAFLLHDARGFHISTFKRRQDAEQWCKDNGYHCRVENPSDEKSAFDAGFRAGYADRLIGHKSEVASHSFPREGKYAMAYSKGYRAGWESAKTRASNPDPELSDAELLYQEFHGRDPKEILKVQRSDASRKTYVACGPLLGIGAYAPGVPLPTPAKWDEYEGLCLDFRDGVTENYDLNKKGVMLAANTEGTQLYAIGGDQDLDAVLDDFDADAGKDLVALCEAAFIVYFDEKPHTRFQGVEYMHKFDQPRPVIGYDRLKKEIFFVGGRYELKGNWLEH